MITYIAFLRGINVSGKNKIPMIELRELCENIKLQDVQTYIQSGNIVFKSVIKSTSELERLIAAAILKRFDLEVPIIVKTVEQLSAILNENPFASNDENIKKQLYFVLINEKLNIEALSKFRAEVFTNEEFSISDSCIYLKCSAGYGKAKLNNNLIERKLKVRATTRNYKTMNKLLEMVG
ncbi:DUF1697 domain-containing protein [Maribacter sp. SA7]|uniref:DUF1697 domain-containing protein n=1 Tax=Maribacter zhoushanensis TaxID=3030012 RepID=UPI0023ED45EA|nr:DUF1697 domain-containing protein [Maribacter zhoushanensis]MDF4203687.1 DUF1697 domain-containing protein [Maribacter zhoushanensis]